MGDMDISGEKREQIIRAAMKNFSKNGYRKTVMDEIVADAGVSKGLVFHYFGSKKALYLYLYEYAYGVVYHRVTAAFDTAKPDLFERIRQMEEIKLEILKEHPYVLDFLASVHREKDGRLLEEIEQKKLARFPDWTGAFLAGVDVSRLREWVPPEKLINLIRWCTNGVLEGHKDAFVLEEVIAEMDGYLELMRSAFYKEEFL